MDPGEDAIATAKREAMEELGVAPDAVEVLGQPFAALHPAERLLHLPGRRPGRPPPRAFTPSEEEVAEVLEVPVRHLLLPATRCEEMWDLRGARVRVPFYAVGSPQGVGCDRDGAVRAAGAVNR